MVQPLDTIATVYNFEVEKTHNYYVGTEGVLVHNNCNLYELKKIIGDAEVWAQFTRNLKTGLGDNITRDQRKAFYTRLNATFNIQDASKFTQNDIDAVKRFVNNFNEGDVVFRSRMAQDADMVDSWALLYRANRNGSGAADLTALTRNIEAISALNKIRKNPNLAKMDLTDDILSSIQAHPNTSYAELIGDLDAFGLFLSEYSTTTLDQFKGLMTTLQGKSNSSIGVHGVIKEILDNKSFYGNKSLTFEYKLTILSATSPPRIDILVRGNPSLFIEVKWYSGTSVVSPALFIKEFIERDLKSINSLDELIWKIRGNKLTKEQVNAFLSSPEGRVALSNIDAAQANRLLGLSNLSNTNKPAIAQAFIDHFNVENNFNLIFK